MPLNTRRPNQIDSARPSATLSWHPGRRSSATTGQATHAPRVDLGLQPWGISMTANVPYRGIYVTLDSKLHRPSRVLAIAFGWPYRANYLPGGVGSVASTLR